MGQTGYFRWVMLCLLFTGVLIAYLDRILIILAAQPISAELSLDALELTLLIGIFFFGYAITALIGGFIVDAIGAKRLFATGMIVWSVVMLLTVYVTSIKGMIFARLLLGMAQGFTFPSVARTVDNWYHSEVRARIMATILASVPFAAGVGSVVVPLAVKLWDWQTVSALLGVLGIFWSVFWLMFATDYPQSSPFVTDRELGQITGGVWVDRAQPEKILRTKELRCYQEKGGVITSIFANRTLVSNYYVSFVFGYLLYFAVMWLPNYLREAYPHIIGDTLGAWMVMLPWILGIAFMAIFSIISDGLRIQQKTYFASRSVLIVIGLLLTAAALLGVNFAATETATILLIAFAVGFGVGPNPLSFAINLDQAHMRAGSSTGFWDASFALGTILAPLITGRLVGQTHEFDRNFFIVVLLILSAIGSILLFQRQKNRPA